jgi:hypothetical protein
MTSLEKGRKLLEPKGPVSGPLFMLDCDGNRHAEPVTNSNPSDVHCMLLLYRC